MYFTTEKTKSSFNKHYDKYGDHYTEHVDAEKIKQIFDDISRNDVSKHILEHESLVDIEQRYFSDTSPLGLFRRCR